MAQWHLGIPVSLTSWEKAGATKSFSQVMGGSMSSLSLLSSVAPNYEITTSCFLLFYRKVSWEAYFAYSDSESCLLSCTYCMSVWNKSRVICPLVYSSLFITVQRWPKDTPSLPSKHPERGFSHSSQNHKYYSSLSISFQWRWSPRATRSRVH